LNRFLENPNKGLLNPVVKVALFAVFCGFLKEFIAKKSRPWKYLSLVFFFRPSIWPPHPIFWVLCMG
jgi:hypothetical protein